MEYTVILDISTIALNRVGYLGSAPPHLFLTCPGRVSVPTTVPTHVPFQRNINCHSNQERILWKNLIACTDILALTKVIQLLSQEIENPIYYITLQYTQAYMYVSYIVSNHSGYVFCFHFLKSLICSVQAPLCITPIEKAEEKRKV